MIAMPDVARARKLLSNAWASVDVQAGQFTHRSARFPGAWSTAALYVHASTGILVYCDSVSSGDGEWFTLRFVDAGSDTAVAHLEAARPPYATMIEWPDDLRPSIDFFSRGPDRAEVGFGSAHSAVSAADAAQFVPILWCCFSSSHDSLLLYADGEIPLNIGMVTGPKSINAIKRELKADFTRQI